MNSQEIIIRYLKNNNYDGLWRADNCGCGIDDLFPCDCCFSNCVPAYKWTCKPGEVKCGAEAPSCICEWASDPDEERECYRPIKEER